MTDFERFCIYCQKEFKTAAHLARHIQRMHPGTYAAASHPKEEK